MKISYKAPAKIILSGEHSVVYTKPALVTAVDLFLMAEIEEGDSRISDPRVQEAVAFCDNVVREYLQKETITYDIRTYNITYSSEIPEGRGMGSSAAFCVATVASILHFYTGKEWEKETINTLAYRSEKHFHGMPSGVDVSASCFGGLIFYRKEFEFLKYISALNFKIPKNIQEKLILIDTGRPMESTSEMVQHVGKRYNAHTSEMEQTLVAIEKTTKKMVVSIVKEDVSLFTQCVEDNQKQLVDFGIVSEKTEKLLHLLQPAGVGKVTGAGGLKDGSGLVLFAVRDVDIFKKIQRENSLKVYPFNQNFSGVQRF